MYHEACLIVGLMCRSRRPEREDAISTEIDVRRSEEVPGRSEVGTGCIEKLATRLSGMLHISGPQTRVNWLKVNVVRSCKPAGLR